MERRRIKVATMISFSHNNIQDHCEAYFAVKLEQSDLLRSNGKIYKFCLHLRSECNVIYFNIFYEQTVSIFSFQCSKYLYTRIFFHYII